MPLIKLCQSMNEARKPTKFKVHSVDMKIEIDDDLSFVLSQKRFLYSLVMASMLIRRSCYYKHLFDIALSKM